jgi:copper chaperone CopZ
MKERPSTAAAAFAATIAAVALSLAGAGCRQRDIRQTEVRVPQVTNAVAQAAVIKALSEIDGIDTGSARFENGVLVIRYDSMKLGIKNIEHAIMDAGFDANDFKGAPVK